LAEGNVARGAISILDWAGFSSAATYTFDDSQPSHLEHYAELQATGVPMTFYISTGTRDEPNYDATWARAVRDGQEIGNHTVHHCHANLTACSFGAPLPDILAEFDGCTAYVKEKYGQGEVWTGASPFGDTGYDAAAAERFFVYRGVSEGTVRPNDRTDPFNLPCHVTATDESEASLDAYVDKARASGAWQILLIHTIRPTEAIWYNPIDLTVLTASMVHAKSLGDVWVDTLANVAAYWVGQKVFAATKPVSSGDRTTWSWTLPPHFPPGKALRITSAGGTLSQGASMLAPNERGYYDIALDAGSLTLTR
jgi:hypothetical protein